MAKDPRTKHQWGAVNWGVEATTTADWLPGTKAWDAAFVNGELGDAEIVVVLVGANDPRVQPDITPQQTVDNLKAIAEALRKQGKRVCLSPVPTMESGEGVEVDIWAVEVNTALRAYLEGTKDDGQAISVVEGLCLDAPKYQRELFRCYDKVRCRQSKQQSEQLLRAVCGGHPSCVGQRLQPRVPLTLPLAVVRGALTSQPDAVRNACWMLDDPGQVHPNSRGYKLCSRDFWEQQLLKLVMQVEWEYFKNKLVPTRTGAKKND
jgi:lysophospholipase L1-like esterase